MYKELLTEWYKIFYEAIFKYFAKNIARSFIEAQFQMVNKYEKYLALLVVWKCKLEIIKDHLTPTWY